MNHLLQKKKEMKSKILIQLFILIWISLWTYKNNIPQLIKPQQQIISKQLETQEKQPLLENDDQLFQDQSMIQIYEEETEQIEEIVDKMKQINTTFVTFHSITEVQQIKIDLICENISTTNEYREESSKKLYKIFSVVGIITLIMIIIIIVISKYT